ncbi:MAG: DUF3299 domain-containing protein [Planctomycetota bacterium]|jgi:hypothetical protein|nr:DUF3299 domain-containing protein [Planctomycetota bacterium]MDP6763301.1 DUF3299 domain-containing protein [Planctomycetota bacterium]MDP6987979.1 DUF3299 domain-containing protein [Planctomycetota bacterium]
MAMRVRTGALCGALACAAACGGGDPAPAVIGEVRGAPLFVPAGSGAAAGAAGVSGAAGSVGAAERAGALGTASAAGGEPDPEPAGAAVAAGVVVGPGASLSGDPTAAGGPAAPAGADAAGSSAGGPAADPAASEVASDLGADYEDLLSPEEAARYEWVDFATLTDFEFPGFLRTDGEVTAPDLPEDVLALDGRLVAIEGFMNPMMFDADGVSEFTLVADPQFCCFGATPQLNHFLYVTLADDERCEFYSIVPLAVYGRLSIGAEEEDGLVLSLYRLEADHVFCVY